MSPLLYTRRNKVSKTKSGLRRQFKTNKKAEDEGVWLELPEAANEDGSIPAFLIKRTGPTNVEYSLELERQVAKYAGAKMTREQNMAAVRECFIKHGMADWRNVQDDFGKDTEYSYEEVTALFDDMPDIYLKLVTYANDPDNYKVGAFGFIEGN
jgi:hypothetical protein